MPQQDPTTGRRSADCDVRVWMAEKKVQRQNITAFRYASAGLINLVIL